MRLDQHEVDRVNIVRMAEKFGTLPSDVMAWMGYPERYCYDNTGWQAVMVVQVMGADVFVDRFRRVKAEQRAKSRRYRRR